MAKIFAHKFTHICPVWLQIHLNPDKETTRIEGTHDIDFKWMKALRAANPAIKIVPRIIWDDWPQPDLHALLSNTKLPAQIGKLMAETAKASRACTRLNS